MADAIERRHRIGQEQHRERDQQQISGNAQNVLAQFKVLTPIWLIFTGLFKGSKRQAPQGSGIDEGFAINDCPANFRLGAILDDGYD